MIAGLVVKEWRHERERAREAVALIPNRQLADVALNARVEKLLASMSLAEKIGQLTQYTAGVLTGPDAPKLNYAKLIAQGQIGSLFNVVGAAKTNGFQRIAVEQSPHHIPLLFGYDVIHGEHTIFPVPLALAATFDPGLVEKVSRVAAEESCADGVRWVFSPMVDIARDARWGRITEGAGEDTYLGSAMARAYTHGYQGDDLSRPDAVAACVKHFAAYGAPNAGREYNTVDMSELSLRQIYLPPYHAAVDAGAATVMSAFNPLNGVPASADPFTLTKILRQEWNFSGFVVSDYGAVQELMNHGVAEDGAEAAEMALTSGVDMDMMSDLYRTQAGRAGEGRRGERRDDHGGGAARPAGEIRARPVRPSLRGRARAGLHGDAGEAGAGAAGGGGEHRAAEERHGDSLSRRDAAAGQGGAAHCADRSAGRLGGRHATARGARWAIRRTW